MSFVAWRPPPRLTSSSFRAKLQISPTPRKRWPYSRKKLGLPLSAGEGCFVSSCLKFQLREYTFSPIQITTNSPGNRLHSFFEWGTNHPGLSPLSGVSEVRSRLRLCVPALRPIQVFSPNRTERL